MLEETENNSDFLKDSEEQDFSHGKQDKSYNDHVKRYFADIGKLPIFSLSEEKLFGEQMCKSRKDVISALTVIKNSNDQEIKNVRKILKSYYGSQNRLKSTKQRRRILYKKNSLWEFVAGFIFEFKEWPSLKELEKQLSCISQNKLKIICKLHIECLRDETQMRLYLEKKVYTSAPNETFFKNMFPKLPEVIISRILSEWEKRGQQGHEKFWKYWQAYVFDKLEDILFLPKKLSCAMEDLFYLEHKFVEANLRLSIIIAKYYFFAHVGSKLDFLDLIQEGNLGLFKAVRLFDPAAGFKFSTFATQWLKHFIQRTLVNNLNIIRMPVDVISNLKKLNKLSSEIFYETGVEPNTEELAEEVKKRLSLDENLKYITPDKIKNIFDISKGVYSLDKKIDPGNENSGSLGDFIEDTKTPSPEKVMLQTSLEEAIDRVFSKVFTEKEITILNLRFGRKGNKPHTLEEIGEIFGVTREYIRQKEDAALRKLRLPTRKAFLKKFLG